MRIGYRSEVSDPHVLTVGAAVATRLVLSSLGLSLDTVHVRSQSACHLLAESGATTFAVWEQARTALLATQLTGAARNISATTIAWDRRLDLANRVREQSASLLTAFVAEPFVALSPDSLHRFGYALKQPDNRSMNYYVPGIDMLLASVFVDDHCFHLTSDQNRVGIVFEPNAERKDVTEIRGTMWLDRASSELRSMEFRYVLLTSDLAADAGGEVQFTRMKNGSWAVSRWNVRMPVFELRLIRSSMVGEVHLAAIQSAGGELVLARQDRDTIWSQAPLPVDAAAVVEWRVPSGDQMVSMLCGSLVRASSGIVIGTITVRDDEGMPADTRVVVDWNAPPLHERLETRPDARGAFRLCGVPVNAALVLEATSDSAATELVDVRIPANGRFARADLLLDRSERRGATVRGTVFADMSNVPISGVEVSMPDLSKIVLTDARGGFQIGGIPPGTHRLLVNVAGYAPLDMQMELSPLQRVQHQIRLHRVSAPD
jgi:hypothetical protein